MIKIGNGNLDIHQFTEVVRNGRSVELNPDASQRVQESFQFLTDFARDKIIYGINTGFGPMAQYRVDDEKGPQLQRNLILSHASGAGKPLGAEDVRALMLCRLNTLMLGYSGVHQSVIKSLVSFINAGITPHIPTHGGVGASGDLVQLAHLAHTLIGEGQVVHNGNIIPVKEMKADLTFAEIHIREGLAIMNGTAAMTGIGLNNVLLLQRLIRWSTLLSAMINEVMGSYDDHVSQALNTAKKHHGQQIIAATMRTVFRASNNIKSRHKTLYHGTNGEKVFKNKVQEYYSLRCVPQILGPVYDTIQNAANTLLSEVNSANDNPIIDLEGKDVVHGGNFHGDYVSFEMDKLKIATTKMTMLAERQLNYLLNNKLNEKLPPFINIGELGFNFGLQGMQFTATSATAENQTLSNPMYVHSIPNNNDNQDIVSMGTNAALLCRKVIDNAFIVLAIEGIAVCQAVDALQCKEQLSETSQSFYQMMRAEVPKIENDSAGRPMIAHVETLLRSNDLISFDHE